MLRISQPARLCYIASSPMKIVIQNPKDSSYLDALQQWTSDLNEAVVFENFRVAVAHCSRHKLGDVQVTLKIEAEPACFQNRPPASGTEPIGRVALPLTTLARLAGSTPPPQAG
jgi:hypothetical protein